MTDAIQLPAYVAMAAVITATITGQLAAALTHHTRERDRRMAAEDRSPNVCHNTSPAHNCPDKPQPAPQPQQQPAAPQQPSWAKPN